MAGRHGKKASSRKPKASAGKRSARPALGNDPFERGAAPREPVPAAVAVAGAAPPPESPVASSTPAEVPPPLASAPRPPAEAPAPAPPAPRPPAEPPPPLAPPPSPLTPSAGHEAERPGGRPPAAPAAPPPSAPEAASLRARLGALESCVESDTATARLRELARQEASGEHARELLHTWSRLLPSLRERLGVLASLRDLLTGKGKLDPFGMDRELFERAMPLLEFLYTSWWRVEPRRIENVPAQGPVIVVANHGGVLAWDALVLRLALLRDHFTHRDLRPLLDERALRAPISGSLASRLGAVLATPDNALRLLLEGSATAVFPEGSRSARRPWPQRYRIDRFGRGGFAKLALRTGATIVPCAIVGSEETSAPFARPGFFAEALGMPFLAAAPVLPFAPFEFIPLPSRWSLRFGEPIDARAAGPDGAEDPARVLELTECARASLQQMLDEDVAARRSVYM